ncbi:MAG: hypothetical protein IPJ41_08400 [Phycisphaerales bacterium]|nr:hypothetical protein [Phycisphaerales bacterium]
MSSARRRLVGAGMAAILLALALGAAGLLTAVGDRFHARFDVTTTGEQRLAPRTLGVLERASGVGEVELVVAVDAARVDRWARQSVRDVLDLFAHAGRVRVTEIDVGSAAGQETYSALAARLVERDRAGLDAHGTAIRGAADEASTVAQAMEMQLSPRLLALRDLLRGSDASTVAAREGLEQWAALARVGSRQLAEAGRRGAGVLDDPALVPPLADAESQLRSALTQRAGELESLRSELQALAGSKLTTAQVRPACESLDRDAGALRDRLARAEDGLARLPRLDILRIAGALASSEVGLVIGPVGTGIAGIDIRALYEPRIAAPDGTLMVGDVRAAAEELFAAGISTVLDPARPIVVLTHGERSSVLENAGFFAGIRERLSQRGIDLTEWIAGRDEGPPDLHAIDPDGVRPVVYVTLSPDSSASARAEGDLAGPERAQALGRAVARILEHRDGLLLDVNPSVLPAYGEDDPVVSPLAALGIRIRTDAPLLRGLAGLNGRELETDLHLLPERGEQPVLTAIRNLPTVLPWATPIEVTGGPSALRATPLLIAPNDGPTWAEKQWLGLWQTPRAQRGNMAEPPKYDDGIDGRDGPWTVALAAERADAPPDSRMGRILIVGSNSWFADPVAFNYQSTDGRVALAAPGNSELFEAGVLWLAGQDELIAQSAGARATPLVGPIDAGRLRLIRWGLVAGLPMLTLLAGVVWRVVRG